MSDQKKCNCIELIREKLKAHHQSEIDFELKMWLDMKTMKSYSGLPPLNYTYTVGKKRKKSHVAFNYCPFCGTKYS